jgi:periplasmic mercuric ion binding protein
MRSVLIAILALGLGLGAAEFPVEGLHLCCGSCKKAVAAATPAATVKGDTVVITAGSADEANAALAALAKAGFHGAVTVKGVAFPVQDVSDVKVDTVTITGIHNCCKGCAKRITELVTAGGGAVKSLDETTLVVTGPVSPKAVLTALNGGGLGGSIAP